MDSLRPLHRRSLAALLLTLTAVRPGHAQQGPGVVLQSSAPAALNELLANAVERRDIPGVVALVVGRDSVLYRAAFGHRDHIGQEPMSTDAVFRIMSMTKPITSVVVMMLYEEGRIALDDPASKYLPELAAREVLVEIVDSTVTTRPAAREVTIRDLLTHTSGFAYGFSDPRTLKMSQNGRPERAQPLLHDPGTRWTYSLSTRFLGEIVQQVTGVPLDRFLETRIFTPLGMSDTGYALEPNGYPRLVALYRRENGSLTGQARPERYSPVVLGDGGLLSTADDYGRFIRMILNGGTLGEARLLRASSVQKMSTNQIADLFVETQPAANPAQTRPFPLGAGVDKFGFGFQITARQEPGLRSPGSLSWAGLYNTHFWIDPERGIGAVFLTQVLPFYDDQVIQVLRDFERTVYRYVR